MIRNLSYLLAVISILALSNQPTTASADPADLLKESRQPGGLAVVVGGDADFIENLAKAAGESWLIEGLTTNKELVATLRPKLADKGLFPQCNVQLVLDTRSLPYPDGGVSLIIVNADALGDDAPQSPEILRALGWSKRAAVIKNGRAQWLEKKKTDQVGEWTHPLHGADRRPVSEEATIGPIVDSIRFLLANETYEAGSGGNPSKTTPTIRLTGGHLMQMLSYRNDRWKLAARCAATGLPYRFTELGFRASSPKYLSAMGHFVPSNDVVYFYPEPGKPLAEMSILTGEILRSINPAAIPEPGDTGIVPAKFRRRGQPVPSGWKNPGALGQAALAVTEKFILQSLEDGMWLIERNTGKVFWETKSAQGTWFASALDDAETNAIYALEIDPDPMYLSLEARAVVAHHRETGKLLWRVHTPKGSSCEGLTGPVKGILPIHYRLARSPGELNHGSKATSLLQGIDIKTGKIVWQKDWERGYREAVYGWDGKIVRANAYRNMQFLDPKTGEEIGAFKWFFNGGGCSFEIFSENYFIHGNSLTPLSDLTAVNANNGVRPACEQPMIPGYGAL